MMPGTPGAMMPGPMVPAVDEGPDLATMKHRIMIALGAVRTYRKVYAHSPNAVTRKTLLQAEDDLDHLLDLLSFTYARYPELRVRRSGKPLDLSKAHKSEGS